MGKDSGKLTVYFEEPFWAGVFEIVSDGRLSVCKVTFGAEPKDYEICEHWDRYKIITGFEITAGAVEN